MIAALYRRFRNIHISSIQPKLHYFQKTIIDFIKRHRTVKVLHLLRNYSAFTVVVSSALLVTATNVASGKNPSGFLFGYWGDDTQTFVQDVNKDNGQENRKSNLAFAPLVKATATVDPNFKEEEISEPLLIQGGEAFLAANGCSMRDPEEDGGVKIYEVKQGDTVSAIAASFKITSNTILWANDIDNIDSIQPGDKLFILPVAGLSYTVKKGDDIDSLAKKYKSEKDRIIAFNDLPANGELQEGVEIIIPDGQKEIPAPSTSGSASSSRRQYASPLGGYPSVSGWRPLTGKAGTGHRFPYGYCTWYVAQRRYVPWGGNAGTWLYHAKVMGYRTGKSPQVGAIMVSSESWWGHVAIVEKVSGGSITISEMNYERWGKVNRRTLTANSRIIKGFIY